MLAYFNTEYFLIIIFINSTTNLIRKVFYKTFSFVLGSGEWKSWPKLNIQKTKIMASSPITSWEVDGETVKTMSDFIFLASKITADGDCSHEIKRHLLLGRKVMTNLDSIFKSRDITFPTSQGYGFSSSHVWMWELDCEESWAPKNWCFWTVVLEKTLESPLDCKEIQPVHPEGN